MATLEKAGRIAFGLFEVDLSSGEIWKAGYRVRLQGQPFKVLAALLARPGQLVTHAELQIQVWGPDTTVDFDRALAVAIKKVREALEDSADNPRFVETLPKRGYRFIAPIAIGQPASIGDSHREGVPSHSHLVGEAGHFPEESTLASSPAPVQLLTSTSRGAGEESERFAPLRRWRLGWLGLAGLALIAVPALTMFEITYTASSVRPPRVTQLTQGSEIYAGPPNPENLLPLVTDGPRIYTSFLIGDRAQIASVDLSGGQLQPISLPDELSSVSIADISRDGSKLIVRGRQSRDSEQPLWIVPTSGLSALRVGGILAHDATFMPGGSSVLFATGDELGIAQLGTGSISRFAALPGRAFWPRWSPSGTRLRFTLLDPLTHQASLWELDANAHHLHRLAWPDLVGLAVCCGSWTVDGSSYVFQASNGGESNVWIAGTGAHPRVTELTNGPLRYASPMTSRADKTVFFVGLETPGRTRFYDQELQRFIPAPAFLMHARRVAYSRDGTWVAWTDVDGRLWRARSPDGTGRLRLTPDDLDVFLAQWSPDGTQLVLMARKPGETWQIYTVGATGGLLRQVLADRRNLADPDWSADGRSVVFGREADLLGKESGPHDIEVLDLTSRKTQVLPGSENLFSPRWSPDGRWILALSLDQTSLLIYDVSERTWRTLFSGSAADPVWSLDSKSVYFHEFADPGSAILRVPVDGGAARKVADLSKLELPAEQSYFFSGMTPAGAPIIEPRIGMGNLFSVRPSR